MIATLPRTMLLSKTSTTRLVQQAAVRVAQKGIPPLIATNRTLDYSTLAMANKHNSNRGPVTATFAVSSSPINLIDPPIIHYHSFSSSAATAVQETTTSPGVVTKKLRVLDMNVVKQILQELRSVDANSDERLDSDELKQLLRKHNQAFTEDEIVEIGELFYAGKSGGSVSFDRFVEAIDKLVQMDNITTSGAEEEGLQKAENPLGIGSCANEYIFLHNHHYKPEDLDIKLTHTAPQGLRDRLAFNSVKGVRFLFDTATGWNNGNITPDKILNRAIYLETIAAVPGMVAAIVRHFKSLRSMTRDGGMMQMFLDEANNERMHLLSFVKMKDPGMLFRAAVIGGQVGFGSAFMLCYAASPKFCHRFVGYVEEEACATYTKIIEAIETAEDGTELAKWRTETAPAIARSYWKLGNDGTVLDMMYAVRADEAEHRDVNHLCSTMKDGANVVNPVSNTEEKLNTMLLKYVRDLMDRTEDKKAETVVA